MGQTSPLETPAGGDAPAGAAPDNGSDVTAAVADAPAPADGGGGGDAAARRSLHIIRAIVAGAFVGIVAIALFYSFALPRVPKLARAALWGIVVLASFAGWGQVVRRIGFRAHQADPGLRLAWGAAVLVFAGSVLALCSLARGPVLGALIVTGAILAIVEAVLWTRTPIGDPTAVRRRWPAGVLLALGPLAILVAAQYLGGASGTGLNVNDDLNAYLVYPKEILATGTLVEPFSVRRMAAYGGQSLLHAFALIGAASTLQLPIVDWGIALVMVVALMLGAGLDDDTPKGVLALAALMLLTFGSPRANTASEMTGALFFLALYRTASWRGISERPIAGAWLLGLLAAATGSLRHPYLPVAGLFLVFFYFPQMVAAVKARRLRDNPHLKLVAMAAGAAVLFLLPWVLLSYRSNRTLLFPFMQGNYRPEYGAFGSDSTLDERIRFFWANICYAGPIKTLPIFLLAGLLIPSRTTKGALSALMAASFFGFALVVYGFPLADPPNISRYYFGFSFASILAITLASLSPLSSTGAAPTASGPGRVRSLIPLGLVLAAFVAQIQEARPRIHDDYIRLWDNIHDAPKNLATQDQSEVYQRLQSSVPAGAPLLVMLDQPIWLDFKRNPVKLMDLPGAASPAPGMPLSHQDSLADYLRDRGYRYVAFVRSTKSKALYNRDLWTKTMNENGPAIWKMSAPFYLQMFDRFDELSRSRLRLYDDGELVALDLEIRGAPSGPREPAAAPPPPPKPESPAPARVRKGDPRR